jgi:hypothetical protein
LPVSAVPPEIWAALGLPSPPKVAVCPALLSLAALLSPRLELGVWELLAHGRLPTNMPLPPLFLEASSSIEPPPLNNEDNPIWVSSGDETPHDNSGQAFQ